MSALARWRACSLATRPAEVEHGFVSAPPLRRTAARLTMQILLLVFLCAALTVEAAEVHEKTKCNPYFPLETGSGWTWIETAAGSRARIEKTLRVQSVAPEAGGQVATLLQTARESASTSRAAGRALTRARCRDGLVTLETRALTRAQSGEHTASAEVVARLPGLPAPADLIKGKSSNATSEITTLDKGRRETIRGQRRTTSVGTETVIVPAGRFKNAVHLVIEERLKRHDGSLYQQRMDEWWARDIGLVQRIISRAGKELAREVLHSRTPPPRSR